MGFKNYLNDIECYGLSENLQELNEVLLTFGNRPDFGQVVILAGGAGCFDGDTEVITSAGKKKIQDIKIGEKVLSTNPETGEKTYEKVLDTFVHQPGKEMLELTLEDNSIIRCTEDHEFLIDGSWVQAKDLLGLDLC